MTKARQMEYKRFAKEACADCGIKANIKDMVLLETGSHTETIFGAIINVIDYVMFEDIKTGRQFQCTYGVDNYTDINRSLYFVGEYRM